MKIESDIIKHDYSKITLCPALNYKCYCQVCGHCEYCQFYNDKDDPCKGCGANFETKLNTNERFN